MRNRVVISWVTANVKVVHSDDVIVDKAFLDHVILELEALAQVNPDRIIIELHRPTE